MRARNSECVDPPFRLRGRQSLRFGVCLRLVLTLRHLSPCFLARAPGAVRDNITRVATGSRPRLNVFNDEKRGIEEPPIDHFEGTLVETSTFPTLACRDELPFGG